MSAAPDSDEPSRVPFWLWPNLLCLDAPVVAVVWLGAFSAAFGVALHLPAYLVMFLAVWCLYAGDRVIDALKLRAGDLSPGLQTTRHGFMRGRIRLFAVLIFFAALIGGLVAISSLERPIFGAGLIVATGAMAYFGAFVSPLGGKKPLPGKELAGGLLIAAGITVPVFADYSGTLPVVPAFGLFAGVCGLNCLMISARDGDLPQGRAMAAVLTVLGIGLALAAAGFAVYGTTVETAPVLRPLYFSLALSGAALTILHLCRRATGRDAFRVLADVALLTPLIPIP
jgi:hypothetical protein